MTLMTLEEVADYLRVTKKTVYRLVEKGEIPSRKVGRLWRFDKSSIETWLHENSKNEVVSILVIDDDDEICSLFRDTLTELGIRVITVNDSLNGLDLIKEHNFTLVFLDLKMPEMDGAELFVKIKAFKPDLPITIITGYPDSDLMKMALACGPLGVMNKPFSASDIMVAINNFLRVGEKVAYKKEDFRM